MTAVAITYRYMVYRNSRYLGDLPNVASPFQYSLDINNGAAPLSILCDVPLYTASLAPPTIDTELGDPIQMETGESFEMERVPDVIGANNSGLLIANDNDLIVWEFSPDYPNGKKVFSGWITQVRMRYVAGQVAINAISYGMDLNDYIAQGAPYITDMSQTNSETTPGSSTGTTTPNPSYGQQFYASGNFNLDVISINMSLSAAGSADVYLELRAGSLDSNTLIAASSIVNITNTTMQQISFAIPRQALTSGTQYSLYIYTTNPNTQITDSATSFGAGKSAIYTTVPFFGSNWLFRGNNGWTMYFYTNGGATSATYTGTDPSVMVKGIIDSYVSAGGKMNYSASSVDLTGLSLTYTFITAKVLDAIKKALDLSPANFYWTVDPATNTLYFKQFATTPSVLLTLGQNIQDLELALNAEGVRNTIYFTGGPTAGVNLLKKYTDTTGLARTGRPRVELLTDNRVTVTGTADQIAASFLAANSTELYETTVTVLRSNFDITTLLTGQSVGFSGFGNFIDYLVLYIVHIDRYSDKAVLTLGTIPPRATSILKELQNNVQDLQTLANPTTPS